MRLIRSMLLALTLSTLASIAFAQEQTPAQERTTVYRAVEGPQTEDVPGGALLLGAYGAAWALVLLFVWRLGKIHAQNAADLAELRRGRKES